MTKATHYGTCQCCGNYQKLPDGFLSNHGYTIEWNMFDGICSGAKHLPFEKDYSLVEKMIERSKNAIVSLDEQIKEVKASTDSKEVWKLEGRRWKRREIIGVQIPYDDQYRVEYKWVYTPEELEGKRPYELRYLTEVNTYSSKTLVETVQYQNEKYANYLLGRVEGFEKYIEWQKERVENWTEKELEDVEKTYSGPKVHVVNARDIRVEDGKVKYKGRQKSGCGRSEYFSKVSEFEKIYKETPEACCKGCVKRFLEIKEVIKQRKEEAL